MPAYTSPDNIQYPVSTDSVAPLETVFANMANSTQDAFDSFRATRATQTFKWADSTERGAQTGMVVGDYGYQSDTDTTYRYSGSAWVVWEKPRTNYTPTLTASSSDPSVGSTGTAVGFYSVAGGLLRGVATFTFGGTGISNGSGTLRFGIPSIAPHSISPEYIGGSALALDDGAAWYSGQSRIIATTYVQVSGDAGQWTNSLPIAAFAAGDKISLDFSYWTA